MGTHRDRWAFMSAPPGKVPELRPDNAGRCLGGTVDLPLVWWRFQPHSDVSQRHDGRVCNWHWAGTNRRQCGTCPAYRGRDAWKEYHGAVWPGSTPEDPSYRNMTEAEHRAFVRAQEAALEDDEWGPMGRFLNKLHYGTQYVDEELVEYRREKVAAWRSAHPEEAKEQNRAAAARYRARKRRKREERQ